MTSPVKGTDVAEIEFLFRRAYLKYCYPDGRPTSRAFKLRPKDDGKLSVDVKSLTTVERSVIDPEKFFIAEIANSDVISFGLRVIHDPLDDGSNYAHALILGIKEDDDTVPSALAQKSNRAYPPFFPK